MARKTGRPIVPDDQRIRELLIEGRTIYEVAKLTGHSTSVVARRAEALHGLSETVGALERERWRAASAICADRIIEMVPQWGDLRDVVAAAKVANDAYLDHRDGRKGGTNIHVGDTNTNIVVEYRDDWRG
jgi:hypothetical protein